MSLNSSQNLFVFDLQFLTWNRRQMLMCHLCHIIAIINNFLTMREKQYQVLDSTVLLGRKKSMFNRDYSTDSF